MRGKYGCLLLVLVIALLCPVPAHAYLDPGTGNVLIYAIISMLGAGLYLAKSFGFAVLKRLGLLKADKQGMATGHEALVIFSEGKAYWYTFKPIVEALIAAKRPFRYLTMDIEDPALTIENDYMLSRYIGTGSAAFARACNVRALLMLATTPNIGTPGYPMPKPAYVQCLAHVLHGVGDVSTYRKYSLDHHQAVLMMGDFMLPTIRHLEALRGLEAKECVSVGIPYLDELASHARKKASSSNPPVILVAPSWGDKGCLAVCGFGFIEQLAKAGYQVIVRPHPQSRIMEQALLDQVQAGLAAYPNISFDFAMDSTASMSRADLLISDKSGIRYDFAFLYEKPVITFDIPFKNPESFEMADMEYVWENETASALGPVLPASELEDILPLVERALNLQTTDLAAFRQTYVHNFGHAGVAAANWLIAKCSELETKALP